MASRGLQLVSKFLRCENIVRDKSAVCFLMIEGNISASTVIPNNAFYCQIVFEIRNFIEIIGVFVKSILMSFQEQ